MSKHVAIVGAGRRIDRDTVERLVANFPADTVVVSGGASGPDTWAEEAARKRGLATKIFLPDLRDAHTVSLVVIVRKCSQNENYSPDNCRATLMHR
jgi:predicted Rossmann fold nucleotide-binding protein DprA/Smf involved in DNA uptake